MPSDISRPHEAAIGDESTVMQSRLHYVIRQKKAAEGFKTGVSLHSHTMHSKESTSFVERTTQRSRLFNYFIQSQLRKYSAKYGDQRLTDLAYQCKRMWWTSPLSASQAYNLEGGQIRDKLGLEPIVSLTDHDLIEAPLQLQMFADNSLAPISVEWTTPYEKTYFHLGIHNLHPSWASEMMERFQAFTAAPDTKVMRELFEELHAHPDVLIVFNHPYWDQPLVGDKLHDVVLRRFLSEFGQYMHALEINGLRTWKENRKVVRLAKETGMKLISGGDRHGREPNATLNLTNASTFAEFVEEIRGNAPSEVCIMPQFHDPLALRILQGLFDMLDDYPEHARGQVRWAQRVFRHCDGGNIKSFDDFFEGRDPKVMRLLINTTRFLTSERLKPAWQQVAGEPSEAAL